MSDGPALMDGLRPLGVAAFVLGVVPLLALTIFSPGIGSEGIWGVVALGWGGATLLLLIACAATRPAYWLLVLVQALLVAAVLYESWSQSALYIGT